MTAPAARATSTGALPGSPWRDAGRAEASSPAPAGASLLVPPRAWPPPAARRSTHRHANARALAPGPPPAAAGRPGRGGRLAPGQRRGKRCPAAGGRPAVHAAAGCPCPCCQSGDVPCDVTAPAPVPQGRPSAGRPRARRPPQNALRGMHGPWPEELSVCFLQGGRRLGAAPDLTWIWPDPRRIRLPPTYSASCRVASAWGMPSSGRRRPSYSRER
jgi:hypothetical protein